jgi:hypothetical protein
LVTFFAKVSAASAGAGLACYALTGRVESFLPWQRPLGALAVLVIVTAVGILLLGLLMKLLRVSEFESYLKQVSAAVARRITG